MRTTENNYLQNQCGKKLGSEKLSHLLFKGEYVRSMFNTLWVAYSLSLFSILSNFADKQ